MNFEFRFPDVGEGIHEGVITEWMVSVGDNVNEGDSLLEVETDKVTTEIPSPRTGKILELKAEDGDLINVGQVIVVIGTESSGEEAVAETDLEDKQEVVEEETAGVVGEVVASSEVIPPSNEMFGSSTNSPGNKVLAVPVVRALAKDLAIDINTVKGTGPNGRITKEDIYKAQNAVKEEIQGDISVAKAPAKTPLVVNEADGLVERVKITRIRKTIANRMSESRFTIPHTTVMDDIDVTKLDDIRKKYGLTFLPFITKAAIAALKQFPEFNSSYDEENEEIILKQFYHIGIATDTDRGLMVPVVRDADKKSITELSTAIADITGKAKENTIELKDLRGSSFTVTNYGSIGGYYAIPIINYPESAILGVGRMVKKPVVKNDEIVIAKVLPLSLSYDHRTIDGASGARFMNVLKELLSDPEALSIKA